MNRTRLVAAAVLTLGLLAPAGVAAAAPKAPPVCGQAAIAKDHKVNKANAKAKAAKAKGKKKGHSKPAFVHAGKVTAVAADSVSFVVRGGQVKALRGCTITVVVTSTTKVNRNDGPSSLASVLVGDHVNVKGTTAKNAETGIVTYTATRVSADGKAAS